MGPRALSEPAPADRPSSEPDPVAAFWTAADRRHLWWGIQRSLLLRAVAVLLLVGAVFLLPAYAQGDPMSPDRLLKGSRLVMSVSLALGVGAVLLASYLVWIAGHGLRRLREALNTRALASGEQLRVLCLAAFQLGNGFRGGYLVITDQRVLQVYREPEQGMRIAEVAQRAEPLRLTRVLRRQAGTWRGLLLRWQGVEEGLRLDSRDGDSPIDARSALVIVPRRRLDALCAWWEAQGHEIGFSNEADLPRPVRTTLELGKRLQLEANLRSKLRLLPFLGILLVVIGILALLL